MTNIATQFKKGQSGNPKGAPKKEWTMKSLIIEALEEAGEDGIPKNKKVAKKLVSLAERGSEVAIKEVNNRVDGMSKQSLEHSGKDGLPLVIIKYADKSLKVADGSVER